MNTHKRRRSLSHFLGVVAAFCVNLAGSLFGSKIKIRALAHAATLLPRTHPVATSFGTIQFWCASASAAKRSLSFFRTEPDTLNWIAANVAPGDHLWDVGANVGIYALYAALRPGVTVTAFEPVAGTFHILAKNIAINGLAERVVPLCVALSDRDRIAPMYLSNPDPGAAMHGFAAPRTFLGSFEPVALQSAIGMRGETVANLLQVRPPDHLKIDVDGHELAVLKGLMRLLPTVRSIWIEMSDEADTAGTNGLIHDLLRSHGFDLENSTCAKDRNRLCKRDRRRPVAVAKELPAYPMKCAGFAGDAVPR